MPRWLPARPPGGGSVRLLSPRALLFQELQLEFESEMQKREHGFRLQADGMSNAVLTQELKVGGGYSLPCGHVLGGGPGSRRGLPCGTRVRGDMPEERLPP